MFTHLGLPMNHYTISFFHAFARSADFKFQLILYLGPSNLGPRLYSRIDTARHLVRSDFFLQRSTQNFEIRRRVSRVKKQTDEIQKEHTLSLSLYLSIRRCNVYFDVPAPVSLSLSLSLSPFANTVWIQIRPEGYTG